MDTKLLARVIGILVVLLGIFGLFNQNTQLYGLNTDLMLNVERIILGVILIGSSFSNVKSQRTAFAIFGIVYLANFVIALFSPTMFGLLPHRYGPTDNIINLIGGIIGIFEALANRSMRTRVRHSI